MTTSDILLETGDFLLLEDGSRLLNEVQPIVGNATTTLLVTQANGTGTVEAGVVEEGGYEEKERPRERPRAIRGYGSMVLPVTEAEGRGWVTRARARKKKVKSTITNFGDHTPVRLHGVERIIPLKDQPTPSAEFVTQIVKAVGSIQTELKASGMGRIKPKAIAGKGKFVGPEFASGGRGRVLLPDLVPVEVASVIRKLVARPDELLLDADLFE